MTHSPQIRGHVPDFLALQSVPSWKSMYELLEIKRLEDMDLPDSLSSLGELPAFKNSGQEEEVARSLGGKVLLSNEERQYFISSLREKLERAKDFKGKLLYLSLCEYMSGRLTGETHRYLLQHEGHFEVEVIAQGALPWQGRRVVGNILPE